MLNSVRSASGTTRLSFGSIVKFTVRRPFDSQALAVSVTVRVRSLGL
jgi:hypothetical protein